MAALVAMTPGQTITPTPALAMPAPSRPPIRAWELEDGMPAYHVTRFHVMAPPSAPMMTRSSTVATSMMPEPTVPATCRPKTRKATKLKNAAQNTA